MKKIIMKKIISSILVLYCGMFFLNSCNQDLLDIEQHGALNPDTYYTNASDAQADQLITSVYRSVYTISNWYGAFNGYSDDAASGNANINVNSQNHGQNALFTDLYRVNYLCNLIIENLPPDSDKKNQVIGEAYFWRAWAYVYLIRGWGTPPLVDHVLGPDELQPENASDAELWSFVDNSLTQAINLLPEKPGLGQQSAIGGRVTKGSASALQGKAQVIRGDYSTAVSTLESVIGSGKYALETDFRDLYHVAADFSDEYMWEWNIDDANQANFENEGDNRAINLTWRTENVTVPGGLTVQGYGGADFNKEFYDFMIAHDGKSERYFGTVWDYEDIQQRFIDLGMASNQEEALAEFWNSVPSMDNCQGYFRSKMLPWDYELFDYIVVQNVHAKTNWPGMRYAEVLLLYAEACVQSGSNTAGGLAAINEVRVRAGIAPLGSYSLQNLKDEKRAELAYEGERYFDLIRWGDAANLLTDRGSYVYSFYGYNAGTSDYNVTQTPVQDAVGFVSNRDELFPFPYNERLLNPNLIQNPGWGE